MSVGFNHVKVMPFVVKDAVPVQAEGERRRLRISGWASTEEADRTDEVIEVGFFDASLKAFMDNPVMLWMHDREEPQGRWESVTPVPGKGYYVEGLVIDLGGPEDGRRMASVEEGLVKSLSVGFNGWYTPEYGYWDNETNKWHWTQNGSLMEISLCTIPCNASATFEVSKALGLQQEPRPMVEWPEVAKDLAASGLVVTDDQGNADWQKIAVAAATLLGARGGRELPVPERKRLYAGLAKQYGEKRLPEFAGEWPESIKAVTFYEGELDLLEAQVVTENCGKLKSTVESIANITRHWQKGGGGPSDAMMEAGLSSISSGLEIVKAGRVLSEANRAALSAALSAIQDVLDRVGNGDEEDEGKSAPTLTPELWLLLNAG